MRDPCPNCGDDCAPECGRHPAGCIYGGSSVGYWLIADGCDRRHSEDPADDLRMVLVETKWPRERPPSPPSRPVPRRSLPGPMRRRGAAR